MQKFSMYDAPMQVYGVPFFDEKHELRRLPAAIAAEIGMDQKIARRTPGARLCFRTNAESITVTMQLASLTIDSGMSRFGAQSACVMIGSHTASRFAGLVTPPNYDTLTAEATFCKSADMEDITILLPRNEPVEALTVTVPDGTAVEAPTPYAHGPVLYYGSSITEGGCACNPFNAYNAILSRHLDLEYYNFGFSNSAKGELAVAAYINTVPMQALIMDYDHNAPSAAHLRETHEPFFRAIRAAHPTLPILILTMPKAAYNASNCERRAAIRATYDHAVAAGDRHVYFIDGETLFGDTDREMCAIDLIHPNDFGFHRMAAVIEPVMKKMLNIKD